MRFAILAVAASVFALPLAAHADLLGDTIHVTYNYPDQNTTFADLGYYTVPVTGSVAVNAIFEITATQIIVTSTIDQTIIPSDFSGFEFTDVSRDPGITAVTLDPSSTYVGTTSSFTSSEVLLNLGAGFGTSPKQGDQAILNLSFAPPVTPPSAVTPEPSSLALLGTGLLGTLGAVRRRFARG